MDGARALNPTPGPSACDRCGCPAGSLATVETVLFADAGIARCRSCGLRAIWRIDGSHQAVRTCGRCALPFATSDLDGRPRCPDCREDALPADLPREEVAAAAEHELLRALPVSLRFVTLPGRSDYLSRLGRAVAAAVPRAPRSIRVVPFQDSRWRTLALPSGTLLVSTGCLALLADEAELAFVLAHELAHVASGDASLGLIRLGLRSMAAAEAAGGGDAWSRAAGDLMVLGHGIESEQAADRVAAAAVVQLGYDPTAPRRLFERIEGRVVDGEPEVTELLCSHPPPRQRELLLAEQLRTRFPGAGPGRTNRELFRRAAGAEVLVRARPRRQGLLDEDEPSPRRGLRHPVVLTTLAIVALALLILVLGIVLTG